MLVWDVGYRRGEEGTMEGDLQKEKMEGEKGRRVE